MSKDLTAYDAGKLEQHLAAARLRMPGPPFREVLRWIHEDTRPRNYVEIGVHAGESLRAALPGTCCIGVDPEPVIDQPLEERTHVYPITSDEFFSTYDLREMLGGSDVALSFIDGLHLADQTITDFVNLERYTGPQSVVLIHDCMPLDEETSSRVRRTAFYSGDSWKVLVFLKRCRPHLRVAVIPTMPTGLAIVSGFGRPAARHADAMDVASEIVPLTWAYFQENIGELFERIPNEREAVRQYLAEVMNAR